MNGKNPNLSMEIDPIKIQREDQILRTILNFFGEIRAHLHLTEMHNYFIPQNVVTLEGIDQIIIKEELDQWLLKLTSVIKNRFLTKERFVLTNNWPREDIIILAVFDLWYQLVWNDFDSMSKLILLNGLEIIIEKEAINHKLLRAVDLTRNIAKNNIKSDLALRAHIEGE